MINLIITFLKIFWRNHKAMFFVILLPAALFIILAFLRVENVILFDTPLTYTDFLLPGIIGYSFMQMGVYTVSYNLIDYRRLLVLKRLSVTPLSSFKFIQSQIIARYVIALIQAVILLFLSKILFHSEFLKTALLLPVVIFCGNAIFMNIGFAIASFAREYEEAAPYTTVIGLGLGFLGDVFFPLKNLPHTLQVIANFLPMKPLVELMRAALFGTSIGNLALDIAVVLAWMIVTTVVASNLFSKRAYK